MPSVKDLIHSQKACEPEQESLYLPSEFSQAERSELVITHLASEECFLREGQAYDCILQLRRAVKTLSALHSNRKKNEQHQKQQTRARSRIQTHEFNRDGILAVYSVCRNALAALGCLNDSHAQQRFPALGLNDLHRKSTIKKRAIGDSRRSDGWLWTALSSGVIDSSYPGAGTSALSSENLEKEHGK